MKILILRMKLRKGKSPKRLKKIRNVNLTRNYKNEKGYMVTKVEEVEEEFWSDKDLKRKLLKTTS